mgnify:CR=1 FL=1
MQSPNKAKLFTALAVLLAFFASSIFQDTGSVAMARNLVAPQADARVRVAHFAPFSSDLHGTSVTVRVNGADALTDFIFGETVGYLDFAPGDYLIEILPTGTNTVALSGNFSLAADTDYTLAAIGNGSLQPLELFAMVDDNAALANGAKLRIAHLAPFAANLADTQVDICTDDGNIVAGLTNIPYKAFTNPYLELPAGDYDLKIAAPGSNCATTLLDLPSVRLGDGDVADVFAIGDIANQPLAYASGTGLMMTPPAMVRVSHFAPFANSIDGTSVTVRANGVNVVEKFTFGHSTDYLPLEPGNYFVEILPTGSNAAAISGAFNLMPDTAYTVAAIGNGTLQPLELFPLVDEKQPAANGAKLRVAHLAPFAADLADTEVDICTDSGSVVAGLTNVPYKVFTNPYLELPAGDYDLKIAAPGSNCATTLLDLPMIRLADGDIRDVFAIGDIINQPLAYTSGTGLVLTPPARVRIAHFAPFASSLDDTSVTVRVNGDDLLTDFRFMDVTNYLNLEPGNYFVEILPSGTGVVAISGTLTVEAMMDYTAAAIGDGANQTLELFPLVDNNAMPQRGFGRVRIAHLAPFAANLSDTQVDICTDAGAALPGLTGIPYKVFTNPYLELPVGEYDLKITAAGSACGTTLIDIPAFQVNDLQVASAFAIGDGANFTPEVKLLDDAQYQMIFFPMIRR